MEIDLQTTDGKVLKDNGFKKSPWIEACCSGISQESN